MEARNIYFLACAFAILKKEKEMLWALGITVAHDLKYKKKARADKYFETFISNAKFDKITKNELSLLF